MTSMVHPNIFDYVPRFTHRHSDNETHYNVPDFDIVSWWLTYACQNVCINFALPWSRWDRCVWQRSTLPRTRRSAAPSASSPAKSSSSATPSPASPSPQPTERSSYTPTSRVQSQRWELPRQIWHRTHFILIIHTYMSYWKDIRLHTALFGQPVTSHIKTSLAQPPSLSTNSANGRAIS